MPTSRNGVRALSTSFVILCCTKYMCDAADTRAGILFNRFESLNIDIKRREKQTKISGLETKFNPLKRFLCNHIFSSLSVSVTMSYVVTT